MKKERRKRKSRRERELISTILDSIPAMVTFFDASGKVRYINRFFEQRTGWSRAVLETRDLVDLCYPDPVIREEAVSFMLSGQPGWRSFPLQAADRSVIYSSWSNVRLSDGSYVGIGIDMTKELLMEERIRSLALQISRAAEMEQQKIAGVIHDRLVQPLASMKLSLEGLRLENDVPEPVSSRLEDVLNSMGDLIQDMRKISHELYPPVLTHLRIDEVLHWLVEQLREQHDFLITIETEGRFPSLDSDKKYFIYAAVRELVHNISKHADAKRVRLAVGADQKEIVVTVQDDGKGFEQSLLENLSHREGGFGLFHIQMRLEQYGGVLSIRSNPGEGTAISIKIPVAGNSKSSVS
jgi:PAS domain S-box-containing protein